MSVGNISAATAVYQFLWGVRTDGGPGRGARAVLICQLWPRTLDPGRMSTSLGARMWAPIHSPTALWITGYFGICERAQLRDWRFPTRQTAWAEIRDAGQPRYDDA